MFENIPTDTFTGHVHTYDFIIACNLILTHIKAKWNIKAEVKNEASYLLQSAFYNWLLYLDRNTHKNREQ